MKLRHRFRPSSGSTGVLLAGALAAATLTALPAAAAAPAADRPAAGAAAPAPTSRLLSAHEAAAQAHATGRPVLATALTTETSQTAVNPDGTLTLTQSAVPKRTLRNGTWTDLDATLKANPDGSLSPAVTPNSVVLSGGGNGPLASLYTHGQGMTLTLPVTLPRPSLAGPSAVYADVLPGVDLTVTVRPTGAFSDVFTIHTPAAARDPRLASLLTASTTTTPGLKTATDNDGNLSVSDATGHRVLTAPAPLAWDSAAPATTTAAAATGNEAVVQYPSAVGAPGRAAHIAKLKVDARPDKITLAPPTDLLTSADAVYPAFVDPTYSPNYGNNGWSSPSAAYPSSSYWNNTVDPTAGISQVGNSGIGESMSLFDFPIDLGTLGGARIYNAYFGITETHSWACPTSGHNQTVDLYAPSATLNSSNATWNSWSGNLGGAVASSSFALGYNSNCPAGAIPPFDVTSTVAGDVSAGKSTQTLAMRADNGSDNYAFKEFQANTANLTVTYDKYPNTPSGLYTSPATNCNGSTYLGDTSVSLYAPVSTPTNSPLTTTFVLYKTSDGSQSNLLTSGNGVNSNTYNGASGQAAVMQLSESFFKSQAAGAVASFSWRVQTSDGTLGSNWSTTCSFNWDPTRPGAPGIAPNPTPPAGSATCATIGDSTDTVQQVGTFCSFTLTPPNGTTISGYQYQVNQSPPVTVNTTGTVNVSVRLDRLVNTLTVNALSPGGNTGSTATASFTGSKISPAAIDGDLTGDHVPDLIVPSGNGNPLPAGLWLAAGNTGGNVTQAASNAGLNGLAVNAGTNPADWTNSQTVSGNFCGYGAQDVLAYFPTGANAGGGDIACNDGSSGPLHKGPATALGTTSLPFRIPAGSLQDAGGNNATQIAAAGNTSGQATGYPDLLATINNQLVLFTSTTPNGYSSQVGLGWAMCPSGCNVLTTLNTPDGTQDWNSWTISTVQLATGTALYLWNPTTGALNLWTGLKLSTNTSTLSTAAQYTIATGWNTGQKLLLRAADINGDGTPDLWAVNSSGTVTTYLNTNNTLTTSSTQTLTAPTHSWALNDSSTDGATITTAADTAGSSPLSGQSGITWSTQDLFNPDAHFSGSGALSTPAVLDLTQSFTVAASVKPDVNGGVMISQDGTQNSGFMLYGDTTSGQWRFCMSTIDNGGWNYDCLNGTAVAGGMWTHLTATYNRLSNVMALYVNGIEVGGTTTHNPVSGFTGSFRVGDFGSTNGGHFAQYKGALANIQAWAGTALPPDQAVRLSGATGYALMPSDNASYPSGTTWTASRATMTLNAGQLTIHQTGSASGTWTQGATGNPNAVLAMQTDGNLVIYPQPARTFGTALWASGTYNNANDTAILQPDGNLVIYRIDGVPLWASKTNN
ncbi:LamG-like jellyroll fold domain-containing protein [Kitasatospora sp. NPDC058965]|uniref:LamG-like jellyroll fold domain-containing protein n=1 Tax=Kitasatospora sp. NPDC058965 TaxID=3346682 RepID=UPI0036BC7C87